LDEPFTGVLPKLRTKAADMAPVVARDAAFRDWVAALRGLQSIDDLARLLIDTT